MNTIELLKQARDHLAQPYAWTKHKYARRNGANRVQRGSPKYAHCTIGALRHVAALNLEMAYDHAYLEVAPYGPATQGAVDALYETLVLRSAPHQWWVDRVAAIIGWNDDKYRRKSEVLALFDDTIARLEDAEVAA